MEALPRQAILGLRWKVQFLDVEHRLLITSYDASDSLLADDAWSGITHALSLFSFFLPLALTSLT